MKIIRPMSPLRRRMLEDMQMVRAALDALTLENDGVDGKSIYIYGEGWDFGEVANNARGKNATQLNIPGTGIGVFNDRLRAFPRLEHLDENVFSLLAADLSLIDQTYERAQLLRPQG